MDVEDRTRGFRGVVGCRGWGKTRVRNVYSDRTIRYNTWTKRIRARFLCSMNRSPLLAIRFTYSNRTREKERGREGGSSQKKRDIESATLHLEKRAPRIGWSKREISLNRCEIYRIRIRNSRMGVTLQQCHCVSRKWSASLKKKIIYTCINLTKLQTQFYPQILRFSASVTRSAFRMREYLSRKAVLRDACRA